MTIRYSGLRFPEGPVSFRDGRIILCEIEKGCIAELSRTSEYKEIISNIAGPNGIALGPRNILVVCNNGGFKWYERDGKLIPGYASENYCGGSVNIYDYESRTLRSKICIGGGRPLAGPNDVVFDETGGFWFTDSGKEFSQWVMKGGVYYYNASTQSVNQAVYPLTGANGIGLSPDLRTLYVAETHAAALWKFRLSGPGVIEPGVRTFGRPGEIIARGPGNTYFDSLAVEANGNICVATIPGAISVFDPEGRLVERVTVPDAIPTNICFGGDDYEVAYITLSSTGQLFELAWPRKGLALQWSQ